MTTTSKNPASTPSGAGGRGTKRLSMKQFFGYGGGDTANNLCFSLAVSFLPLYYTDVALISPAVVGLIFLIMRFVDAFTDIAMGSLIDRTNSRWGKFRPWILFGSVPLVVLSVLAFSMPQGLYGTSGAIVWAAVTYFLMGSVAFTAVNIPYGSLAAAMTDNRDERARLAIFRTVGAAVMQVLVALLISPAIQANQGDPDALQSALTRSIVILGVFAIALYAFLFFVAKENVERKVARVKFSDSLQVLKSNRALQMLGVNSVVYLIGLFGVIGVLVYYTRDVLGNALYMAPFAVILYGMVILISWTFPGLIRKFGKPRLFQIGSLSGAIGAALLFLATADAPWLAWIGIVLVGISSGYVNSLMWNMEADTIEYGEWKTGLRTEGTTYAIFSFMRKLGQAFAGAFGVWVIGWFGYEGGAVEQTSQAELGIRVATGGFTAIAFLLAAILMFFYPLTDQKHREILTELRTREDANPPQPTA